jgi:signal transduction histidine kinase
MDNRDKAASLVHAAKNRLQMLQPRLAVLRDHPDLEVQQAGLDVARQIDEVNQQLVLMLSLYRLEETDLLSTETVYLIDELELCQEQFSDQRIQLDCPADLETYADRRLLQAVLSDALHNAVKYCREGISIEAVPFDNGVRVRIFDDGAGQPDNEKAGTGVGLWLANRIAEAHRNHTRRGYAKHFYDPELGSCFELFLP